MSSVKIYTTPYCPFCTMTKRRLEKLGIDFENIDVSDPEKREEIRSQSGWPTVPVIYVGEELIGGYDELQDAERAGRLDELLGE